jgi:hypothetical protein
VATRSDKAMNDVMLMTLCGVLFTTEMMYVVGDAGANTVWVSDHRLSGLIEFSHCVLWLLAGFPS